MGYDNNDFQGDYRQLAGEGSSKLSPVLRDYALPKFDFDDSVNGHLRFDSLVENKVFLGIPNQEDNQWIDDFSRGSTGIEFSSSATEPCSISRRNNVWSEAASSESVEMLLNSVGQEESILGETIIEELNVGDEFGRLTTEMELNVEQDDKIGDAIHSQPALLPEDFSVGRNESIGAADPSVGCNSEAQKDDSYLLECFSEVDSHVEGSDKMGDAIHSQSALLPVDFSAGQNDNIGGSDPSVECDSEAQRDDSHILKSFSEFDSHVEGGDKIGDAIHPQPALLPVDFSAGQNDNIGAADPFVECNSEALKNDPSLLRRFSEVDSHVESVIIVSGVNVGSDKTFDNANQMEVDNFSRESLISREELHTCSEIQIGTTSLSSHIPATASCSMELNEQENIDKATDLHAVSVDGLLEVASGGLERHMVGQISNATAGENCTKNIDDPQCVPSRLESVLEKSLAINVTKRSELKIMRDSDLENEEGCNNDTSSSEPSRRCNEVVVCSEEADASKQPHRSLLENSVVMDVIDESLYEQVVKISTSNDTSPGQDIGSIEEQGKHFGSDNQVDCLEGQKNEVNDGNGGSSFHPELEMESILEKENSCGSYNQVDRVSTEAYVLPEIDCKIIEQGDGSGIDRARDLSSLLVACSSVKLRAEQSSDQSLSDVNNAAEVSKEECIPEGHLPFTLVETMQRNIKILSCKQVFDQRVDQDVSLQYGENAMLPVESSGLELRVHGSVHDDGSKQNVLSNRGLTLDCDSSTGNESGSKYVDEGLSSHKLNGVLVFPGDSASADEVALHNSCLKSPLPRVLSKGSVENEGTIIELEKDVIMPGVNNSLQVESVVEHVSEDPLSDDGKASQRDQAANQEFSINVEVCSGHCGSKVEQVEGIEVVGSENEKYKDVSMKSNAEEGADKSVAPTEALSSTVESFCQKGHECSIPSGTQSMGKIVPSSKDAMIHSDKNVAPAEAISSMVESCCQMGQETVQPSVTQIMGQIVPSVKVVSSVENPTSTVLAFPSIHVTDIMNEDGDKSDNLVKENCESPTIISCAVLPAREKGQQDEIKQTTVDIVLQSESTHDTGAMVKSVSLQDEKNTSKEEKSFNFEVRLSGPSEGDAHKSWQSFHNEDVHKISTSQIDPKATPKNSYVNAQVPVEVIKVESAKGTPQRTTRRSSGKATARQNAKKENHLKGITPLKKSEKVDKAIMYKGSPGTGQIVQLEELKSSGDIEQNGAKACGVLPTPTSSLPDLNTLVPATAFFQQPFTDLQQVQLRAQILVYGSLMQEAVPDEACMISAFGPAEGGGSIWHPVWHSCIERVRGQQSHTSNSETPVQSRFGSKAADIPVKHSSLQNKVVPSPAARVSSKGIQSPASNPMIPLSSPLWNVSSATCDGFQSSGMSRSGQDYHQPLSPVYPYQATGVRNFSGHDPSWLSQAPFPGPWMASPQIFPFDVNTRFTMFPNTQPVKLTPATNSPVPHFPSTKHGSLPAVASGVGGSNALSGTESQPFTQHSTKPKPRKSKKIPVTEGLCQISSPNLSQTALTCVTAVGDHFSKALAPSAVGQKPLIAQSQSTTIPTAFVSSFSSTSVAVTTHACIVSTSSSGNCPAALSPVYLTDEPIRVDQNVDKGVVSNETSMPYLQKATASFNQHSTDPTPRKRKKVPVAEGPCQTSSPSLNQTASPCTPGVGNRLSKKVPPPQMVEQKSLFAQSQTDTIPTTIANNLSSTSVVVSTPAQIISTSSSVKLLAALSPSLSEQHKRVDHNGVKRGITNETLNTVEEAKRQAEIAALHAATAVGHCNDVWSQLYKHNNSGLTSDVEAKLGSAAMAIAAASSVANAAAAAAKIASSVAVQAKLMAEEVLVSSPTVNSILGTGNILSNVPTSSGNAAPSSILKDGDGNVYPSSIIAVAREAARKRVEAASAASKHTENLDAIVKAAELVAEAVSHAGKIVSIGDSFPLSKLIESGPGDYWKSPQGSTEKGAKLHTLDCDQANTLSFDELHNVSAEQSKMGLSVMEEVVKPGTVTSFKKDSFKAHGGRRASSTMSKNIGVVRESETGSRFASSVAEDAYKSGSGPLVENRMREGCLVEVLKDGGNFKAAWYSANILNVKDGKAFVCYTEHQADEGQLKEWVSFEGDVSKAPTVRIAHPTTTMRFDGTRKRRREAMMDYTWSVGDRVDAWMEDCWREGIVREKNKNDETTLKIYFPALEDTLTARAWYLRPTLTWKDGEWIEWSSEGRHSSQVQGNARQGKRVKLGSPTIEAKGKDKMSTGVDLLKVEQHEESSQLPLSANEKEFNVGKSTRHANKVDTHRTVRMGLPKESSRVVFGVPKPGKKRKFMDVSKHFDSDRCTKNISSSDSVKFSRYLVPEGSGSRGWKTSTINEVKERPAAEDKTKALRSGKAPSALVRAQKVKLTSVKSGSHDATKDQHPENVISSEERSSGQQNLLEFRSLSNSKDTSEGLNLVSSLGPPWVTSRKVHTSTPKSVLLNKGKLAATTGRLNKKIEPQDKLITKAVEPRRSIRKIQPTSRLLEGLQSSLVIPKMPSVPYDKNQRSQNRSNIKGNTNHI